MPESCRSPAVRDLPETIRGTETARSWSSFNVIEETPRWMLSRTVKASIATSAALNSTVSRSARILSLLRFVNERTDLAETPSKAAFRIVRNIPQKVRQAIPSVLPPIDNQIGQHRPGLL